MIGQLARKAPFAPRGNSCWFNLGFMTGRGEGGDQRPGDRGVRPLLSGVC